MVEAIAEETIHGCEGSSSADSESERSPVFEKETVVWEEENVMPFF